MANELAVRSSLPLQILLYLNQWYYVFWLLIEALVFVFKGQTLPFADGVLGGEIALFIILYFVDLFRIYFTTKGNLTERNFGLIVGLFITIPCIAGFYLFFFTFKEYFKHLIVNLILGTLYFILWQHYVLRIEFIINIIQLVFLGFEFLLIIIAIIVFARSKA